MDMNIYLLFNNIYKDILPFTAEEFKFYLQIYIYIYFIPVLPVDDYKK